MPTEKLQEIAEKANLIVNGYAFTVKEDGGISILNLEHPECAMVVSANGEMIETNMDDIEQQIVKAIFEKNHQFLEEENA